MRYTKQQLAQAILTVYSKERDRSKHRINVLGRSFQSGALEYELKTEFTNEERALGADVFAELLSKRLLVPTYADIMSPEEWLVLTEKGEYALKTGVLDELDEHLLSLHSEYDLLQMRRGIYEAMLTQNADWERHVATSATELITKVLHTIAPDDAVRNDPAFVPNTQSQHDISRKERIKYYLRSKQGSASTSDITIIERACDLVEECYNKLNSIKHTDKKEVEHLIRLTEDALLFLLDR